ncbi:MAG TPA: beta-galactosidase, partial [Chloroflexota bacterium]|nr:beta-galactosidase [Chloroflexota bacterium]
QSLVLKSILWAAKKEPQVQFNDLGVGGDTINRAELTGKQLTAHWRGATNGMQAHVTVRDEDKTLFLKTAQEIPGKDLSVKLPVLPAGKYFADVIIRAGQNCVNWGSVGFTVVSDLNITALSLDKPAAKANETVTATATLSASAPADMNLYLEVVDNLDRLIVRKSVTVAAGSKEIKVPFQLADPLALSARVTAYLVNGSPGKQPLEQACVAKASRELFVPLKRSRGNYAHAVWSADGQRNDFVRRIMLRQLRACDVDLQTNAPTNVPGQAWLQSNNFDTIPYATRYSYEGSNTVREPCLTDPKFLGPHLESLEKIGRELGPMGPRAYTLGDECFLARDGVDVCFSPTCIADFQQWLQGEYGNIAALNASWGTNYGGFGEAQPITLQDAKKAGRPVQWVDHRRHMEFVYARMMQRAGEAIRKADPEAEVGFDGPFDTNSFSGNDWSRLMQAFTMVNVYFHQPTQWEFVRLIVSPPTPRSLNCTWGSFFAAHRMDLSTSDW